MPVKLTSVAGGAVTINPPNTASTFTLTLPAATANLVSTGDTGVISQTMIGSGMYAGYGPAFFAYNGGGAQSVTSGVITKIALTSTLFDTSARFDTSLYRFLPLVAGYYQVNCNVLFGSVGIATSYVGVQLYKNGSSYSYTTNQPNNTNWAGSFLSTLVRSEEHTSELQSH